MTYLRPVFLAVFFSLPLRIAALENTRMLPLAFEPNQGQADPAVRFLSRGAGYGLFLTGSEAILTLRGSSAFSVLRMRLVGCASNPRATGLSPLAARSHYFFGRDLRRRQGGVPNYARVRFAGIYPGIDLVYYGSQGRLEFDFLLAPGADVSLVRLEFHGAQTLRIDSSGDLLIETTAGLLRQLKPRVTQDDRPVQAAYVLAVDRTVGLHLAPYDTSLPLRIDPVVVYASYLGGNAGVTGGSDYGRAVALDSSGNIYVAGSTEAADFPVTRDAAQQAYGGGFDAFLMKLDRAGNCLYASYWGGEGRDEAFAVAVDTGGNAYVAGSTSSQKFPVTTGAPQSALAGYANAFIAKFDPAGTLVYSTLLGGEGVDSAAAIAAVGSGTVYVAGSTTSAKFPVTAGSFQQSRPNARSAFAAKLDPSGGKLLYSTYLGGTISNQAVTALAVDSSGNAYLAGQTSSRDFPVTAGAYRRSITLQDGFVVKLNASGTALIYSTLLGGRGNESIASIALDSAGNVYVGGSTTSLDLPVTKNAIQASYGGGAADGFLAKLNGSGTALLYCTYLGGTGHDAANAIAVHPDGGLYIAGETQSADFPVSGQALQSVYGGGAADGFLIRFTSEWELASSTYLGGSGEDRLAAMAVDPAFGPRLTGYTTSPNFPCAPQAWRSTLAPGGFDAFLAGLDLDGTSLPVSTYLGGSGYSTEERALDIAVDRDGFAYITGQTMSTNFPITAAAAQPLCGGNLFGDAFVAKIAPDGKSLVYATYLGGGGNDVGTAIAVDGSGSAYIAGTTASTDFPTTQGAYQTMLRGAANAFVARLSPDGGSLIYSTLLGVSYDSAAGLALLADGSVLVAGSTNSGDFPVTSGAFQTTFAGYLDAFVAKLSADGSTLVFSTFLGGQKTTSAMAVAADDQGNAYVTGTSSSGDFPVTQGAFQSSLAGPSDAFIVKLDPAGASLRYSTLLGGGSGETGRRIAVDSAGYAFVAGGTGSDDFPVTRGAPQSAYGGGGDAFIARLSPDGSGLAYATFLGGAATDEAYGLALDPAGNAYVTGMALSFVFPTTAGRLQAGMNGAPDAFLAKLDPAGKSLLFSSQYGFAGGKTVGYALALDASGHVLIAGQTSSPAFHTTSGAFQPSLAGPSSGFAAKFDMAAPTPAPPVPSITSVVNYATGTQPVCGGGIVTILGENLAAGAVEFAKPLDKLSGNLPTRLGDTVVQFGADRRAMPLFSVSRDKIVAQLPYLALDTGGDLTVKVGSDASQAYRPSLGASAFGIFAVYNQDLSAITESSPVKPGGTIIAYVTGFGKTNPAVPSGAPAPAGSPVAVRYTPADPYVSVVQGVAEMKCEIASMTLVPGTVGVAQAVIRIGPVSSDDSRFDLVFKSGGGASNRVRIWINAKAD